MLYVIIIIVTLVSGSSFATIPIIVTLFVADGASLGLRILSLFSVVGTAVALCHSGAPTVDSTLGSYSGLD
ncbi:Na+/H+ antiporter NhaC family protein, partial [Staphylococcus sp. SIMBA_130]